MNGVCFIVRDKNGQQLGYFYYEVEPGRRTAANLLTKDEAPATTMETNMAEDVSSTIAALEDERYTAMLSGNAGMLDRLLDDRLRHVHSSGHVDNKASWMRNFGRLWQYRSIERQDQTIVPLGDSALVFNALHIDVQVADVLRKGMHAHSQSGTSPAVLGGWSPYFWQPSRLPSHSAV